MLDKMVSVFDSTEQTYSKKMISIGQLLVEVQEEKYLDQINKLRSGDKLVKKTLPMIAAHGVFDGYRRKDNFIEASGLIILDIDDVIDDLNDVKEDIMQEHPSALAAMISPSGTGIKVLYLVDESFVSVDNYRAIGRKLSQDFKQYGAVDFLSVTDCLIMTADKDILINENCYPKFLYLEEKFDKVVELEPLDKSKELYTDAEELFETVLLDDIAGKTNNNFHFIQVSILDLAKMGFKHPEHDLSFVVEHAESLFKPSPENARRFQEVCEIAQRYPLSEWPYKFTSNQDEGNFDLDYTDYITKKESSSKPKQTDSVDEESDGHEENTFLIDYQTVFNGVVERIKEGNRIGREISLKNFADIFRFKGSGILVVTGIPGHGKTEWVDQILVDLARLYGEQSLVVGFEQTAEEHIIKLVRKALGKDVTCPSYHTDPKNLVAMEEAVNWVTSKVKHFDTRKSGGNIDKILVEAAKLKQTVDYKYLVLDPFNMLSIKSKANGHEKIEEILRKLTLFSHQLDVMIILIAHPFKMKKDEKTGEYEIPDFYSVKGSSAFFEMAYHGLTIYRRDSSVLVRVLKVKQNNLGKTGKDSIFDYDKPSGRYIPLDEEDNELPGDHWDLDWIKKANKI